MRYGQALLLAVLGSVLLASCSPGRAAPEVRRIGFWNDVIASHRISGNDRVRVGSLKAAEAGAFIPIGVDVEIAPSGEVIRASVDPDDNYSGADTAPAIAAAQQWRFRPFEYDGAPVIAVGTVYISYQGPELWDQPDAPLPEIDYRSLSITLERSACYGSCPDYRVEIKGDGEVVFTSRAEPVDEAAAMHRAWNVSGVLVPGRHVSRIDRSALEALVERFRQAHFFGLKDSYQAGVTDNPTYVLTFQTGRHRKRVVDYVGNMVGMPEAMSALEDEVDRVAGTGRWVKGDSGTVEALASEGFDFSSAAARSLLVWSIREAPERMILELIARGVPLDSKVADAERVGTYVNEPAASGELLGQVALKHSILAGRPAVFAELVRRGWLRRTPMADLSRAFAASGGGCSPIIAEALIGAGIDPAARNEDGKTALMAAVGTYPCGRKAGEDVAPLVSLLIRLGVPVNAADKEGKTALFKAEKLELVKLLLAAGARVDVRDKEGISPAFWSWDDSVVLTLLEAGADPSGRNFEKKTLRESAREHNMPGTLAWLDEHRIN